MLGIGQPTRRVAIVDTGGAPIDSENVSKIVDLGGRLISSAPIHKGPQTKVDIEGFVVAAMCSDGHMRQVTLERGQTRKLSRLLKRMHGGALKLQAGPLFLMVRKDKKAAEATPEEKSNPSSVPQLAPNTGRSEGSR